MPDLLLDRRGLMLGAGSLGLTSLPLLAAACAQPRPAPSAPGRLIAGDTCPVTPAQTEGPFYFDPKLVRSAIAEGRPGIPLRVRLQIVDAADCAAFKAARVDIWHCDAAGRYSGYDSERSSGETFLRGVQFADAQGIVSFATVYPGWYEGRAPHIHCKARTEDGREITSQLYFPDALSDAVYGDPSYAGRAGRRLRNGDDGLFRSAGATTIAETRRGPNGYDAALVLALR